MNILLISGVWGFVFNIDYLLDRVPRTQYSLEPDTWRDTVCFESQF